MGPYHRVRRGTPALLRRRGLRTGLRPGRRHAGDPARAAALAEFDARYTRDSDGVHGARAMAAAVALAPAGACVAACVAAVVGELPEETEIGRNARHSLRLAADTDGAFALVPLLEHQIVDHVHSYGVPAALALPPPAAGSRRRSPPRPACPGSRTPPPLSSAP